MSVPPIVPQPMDLLELAEVRCALDDDRHGSIGPIDKLIAAHDYYRARCSVLASDVGPEHTAARVLAYALANDWVRNSTSVCGGGHYFRGEHHARLSEVAYLHIAFAGRDVSLFCDTHAQASGIAPLDVLAAIGAMP